MPDGGRRNLLLAAGVALVAAMFVAASAPAASEDSTVSDEEAQPTGRVIALFEPPPPGASPDSPSVNRVRRLIDRLLDRTGLQEVRALAPLGAVALKPRAGESFAQTRDRLLAQPGVIRVEREYARPARYTPNDPSLRVHDLNAPNDAVYQWNLKKQDFRGAWNFSKGRHAKLAVLDTGLSSHPDLNPRVIAKIDSSDHDNTPGTDEDGHGTHVAGLACANGDDGRGVLGGAFKCKLLIESLGPDPFPDSDIAAAIKDATNRGADVLSMSFGGGSSSSLITNAVNYAWNRDVVMVAASCNTCGNGDPGPPADLLQPPGTGPNIHSGKGLAVTAAEFDGTRADFGGSGPGSGSGVSIAGYGDSSRSTPGIFSTCPPPGGLFGPDCGIQATFQGDNRYGYLAGTSMATPQVAGAAALIRSNRSGLSASKVIRVMKRHAKRPGGVHGPFTSTLGWGILDAGDAIAAAS
jgi:serine protease